MMKPLITISLLMFVLSGCGVFDFDGQLELLPSDTESSQPISTPQTAISLDDTLLYPVLADAYNLLIDDGSIIYNSKVDLDTTLDFYEQEMTRRGWMQDGYFELQANRDVSLSFINVTDKFANIVIYTYSANTNPYIQVIISHEDGFINIRDR